MQTNCCAENLIEAALQARKFAYAPYSHFTVGAALLAGNGKIYCGCNIENSSYGAANCAERTAIFKAVSEGQQSFEAIAVVGGMEGQEPADYANPCGICRQVMQEFCDGDFRIYVGRSREDYREYAMRDILPFEFGGDSIQ